MVSGGEVPPTSGGGGWFAKIRHSLYESSMIPYAGLTAFALVVGYPIHFFSYILDIDEETLKFSYLPRVGVILACGFLVLWLTRRANCIYHRRRSRNPDLRTLDGSERLTLLPGYEARIHICYNISPVRRGIKEMRLWSGWHGDLNDVDVESFHRCQIKLETSIRSNGINITAVFPKALEKGVSYQFEYILKFKNTSGKIGPFIAKRGAYLPEKKFTLTLDAGSSKGGFVQQIFRDGNSDPEFDVAKSTKNVLGQQTSCSWIVSTPKHGLIYKLSFYQD